MKEKETEYERGKKRVGKYSLDIEELQLEDTWDKSRDMRNGSIEEGKLETTSTRKIKNILVKELDPLGLLKNKILGLF